VKAAAGMTGGRVLVVEQERSRREVGRVDYSVRAATMFQEWSRKKKEDGGRVREAYRGEC